MTMILATTAHRVSRGIAVALMLSLASLASQAQYPNKPVRLVLPFGPGSATDTFLRIVAEPLGTALGQSVVVDNKPGAMSVLAVEQVAKSPADGYTVVAATNSIVANPAGILRSVNYDPFRDFTPITRLAGTSYVLVMAADQPLKTLDELVAHARANPGKLNYASGNLGGVLYGGMLQKSIGVNMVHVPYKSTPPALLELLSGPVVARRDQSPQYGRDALELLVRPPRRALEGPVHLGGVLAAAHGRLHQPKQLPLPEAEAEGYVLGPLLDRVVRR